MSIAETPAMARMATVPHLWPGIVCIAPLTKITVATTDTPKRSLSDR